MGDERLLADDARDLRLQRLHGGERDILPRLRRDVDLPDVLGGQEPLVDGDEQNTVVATVLSTNTSSTSGLALRQRSNP